MLMNTKKCTKCQNEKEVCNFHYKKTEGRHSSWCKTCVYGLQKDRWKARKIKAVNLMGSCCSKCGYDRNYAAFHFHHVDPTEKSYEWNKMRGLPWAKVVAELKKCILLCSNCHSETHWPELHKEHYQHFNDNNTLNRECSITHTGQCPQCDEAVYGTKYCSVECSGKSKRVVKRPSTSVLEKDVREIGYSATGRKYGVSDNAIRKWLK
jgi:hypothetical protein